MILYVSLCPDTLTSSPPMTFERSYIISCIPGYPVVSVPYLHVIPELNSTTMHWHGNVNHHVVKHTHSVFLSYNLNCLNSIRCASTSAETFNSLSASSSSSTVQFPFPEHLRPTPYEIFHLRPGASPNAIKSRCTVDALMYCVFRCF